MKRLSALFLQTLILSCALLGATQLASAASDTWVGNTDANWSTSGNWDPSGNAPPLAGDSLSFGVAGSSGPILNNTLTPGTAFSGLTFSSGGSAFTLNGFGILLSGQANGNTTGIANRSGQPQVIGTMPLTLDWGCYEFGSSSPGTVALNNGLTLNVGGVAYFDPNVTSTSLVNDGSGLISGLGGAGVTICCCCGSNGSDGFTGLATMSGTAIVAYSGWPSVVTGPGTIGATTPGAAVNIELTATAAGNYTFANGSGITYANTIFLSAASAATLVVGSTAGAQTLDLGAVSGIGGIYLPAGVTAQAVTIGSGASTILTAGPETGGATPGTIVFGINGTSAASQALNNSTIKDNLSGGAVTVVKTGPGSMFSGATLANTYSGGTYVNQGQFQANNISSFGTGPVYVATNASIYFNGGNGVTYANELYLSPGVGAGAAAATANGGALIWGGNGATLSGKVHLLGAPVTTGPGCRISTIANSQTLTLSGQITGTGTLELYQGGHSGNTVLANAAANNNWTGGLLIAPKSTLSAYFKLGLDNQIPNGPGTGDIILVSGGGDARFDLNGHSTTINGLNAPSTGTTAKQELDNFGTANSTLTLGANNASGTFYGVMGDNGTGKTLSLVKIGAGTQTMRGANTCFGTLTISAGTFALAGTATMANVPTISVASGAIFDAGGIGGFTVGAGKTLAGLGTVVGSTVINGTVNPFMGAVGTLTNNGSVTFAGGGTYVWYINNATGLAGTDSGWGLLNISSGGLVITATSGTKFNIKITSLTAPDVAGNAANFNPNGNYSWTIAQSASAITGFDPAAFVLDTSAFSNPLGNGSFSIELSGDSLSLVLKFTSSPVITTPLVNQTNGAGGTVVFTVVANGATPPITFQWLEGSTVLVNGGTSGGATVTINSSGHTSTLTLTGVQDADAGSYTVNASDNFGALGTSSATLTVVLPTQTYPVILTGLNLIANQLDHGSNTLNEIMPSVPDGSVLYKYNNASGTWSNAAYSAASGSWAPANLTLSPGEGAFFQSPSNFTLTFTGTPHVPVLPVTIPNGAIYLLSRQTNDIGNYTNIVGVAPSNGATVYRWSGSNYNSYTFVSGAWTPSEPAAAVGEAVWVNPAGGSGLPPPPAPVITQQPQSQTNVIGSNVTFSVAVTGTLPLTYQWYFNITNIISGATNTTYTIVNAQTNNAGTYDVVVSNASGVVTSAAANLRIAEPVAELAVTATYAGPAGSCCCWDFDLLQVWGAPGNVTIVEAFVPAGVTVCSVSGPGTATWNPDTHLIRWDIPGSGGLIPNGPATTVHACFSGIGSAGTTLVFTGYDSNGYTGPFLQESVTIGANGECTCQTELWMKDTMSPISGPPDDIGSEPNGTTAPMWISSDIWVRNKPDSRTANSNPGLDPDASSYPFGSNGIYENEFNHQNPLFCNCYNYVYVKVRNRGCLASSGNEVLRVYWASAATGLPWSTDPTVNMIDWTEITGPSGLTLPPIQPTYAYVAELPPWLPPNPSEVYPYDGHFCLVARIERSSSFPFGMTFPEGNSLWDNVYNNNNIVQKNVHVVPDTIVGIRDNLIVRNTATQAQPLTLQFSVPPTELTNNFLLHGDIVVDLGNALLSKWQQGGQPAVGFVLVTNSTQIRITDPTNAVLAGMLFGAGEAQAINVTFQLRSNDPLPAGLMFNWDITQIAPLASNAPPSVVGGERYTYVTQGNPLLWRASGGILSLSWIGGGVLQQADNLAGPWTDLPSAISPYSAPLTAPKQFYRVVFH